MPKKLDPERKAAILKRVAEIGASAAAKEAGVSYNAVMKWKKEGNSTSAPAAVHVNKIEEIEVKISETEEKIVKAEETLKALKADLKTLQKAKEKAEKEKALLDEAEKKKQLMDAVLKSGKSVEEILEFLK